MSTIFEKIIAGEIPGRFVYADDEAVAFATIEPVQPGHVLVIPRSPYPAWTDAPPAVAAHLMEVAHLIGASQLRAFDCERVGLIIAGFDVPHTHLHVIPVRHQGELSLANSKAASEEELTEAMTRLRKQLVNDGAGANVPKDISSPQL